MSDYTGGLLTSPDRAGELFEKYLPYEDRPVLNEIASRVEAGKAGGVEMVELRNLHEKARAAYDDEEARIKALESFGDVDAQKAFLEQALQKDEDATVGAVSRGYTEGRIPAEIRDHAKRYFKFRKEHAIARASEATADIQSKAMMDANFGKMAMVFPNTVAGVFGADLTPGWLPGIKMSQEEYDEAKRIASGDGKFGVNGAGRVLTSATRGGTSLLEMLGPFKAATGAAQMSGAPQAAGRFMGALSPAGGARRLLAPLAHDMTQGAMAFGLHEGVTGSLSKLLGTEKMQGQEWSNIPGNVLKSGLMGAAIPVLKEGTRKLFPGLDSPARTKLEGRAKAAGREAPVTAAFAGQDYMETGDPWSALGTAAAFTGVAAGKPGKVKGRRYYEQKAADRKELQKYQRAEKRLEQKVSVLDEQIVEARRKEADYRLEPTTEPANVRKQEGEARQEGKEGRPIVRYLDRVDDAGSPETLKQGAGALVGKSLKQKSSGEASLKALETKSTTLVKVLDEMGEASSLSEYRAVFRGLDSQAKSEGLQLIEKKMAMEGIHEDSRLKVSTNPRDGAADRWSNIMSGWKGDLFRVIASQPKNLFKGLRDFGTSRPESSYYSLGRIASKGDLAKHLSWTKWIGNSDRVVGSVPSRLLAEAELRARAETEATIRSLRFVMDPMTKLKKKDRQKWMKRLSAALDGLRPVGKRRSGTDTGEVGTEEKIQQAIRTWSRRWDAEHRKSKHRGQGFRESYKLWREILDNHRARKGDIAGKENWGLSHYFQHVFDYHLDANGRVNMNEAYSKELPGYARTAARNMVYDKSMMPRLENDLTYVLDPLVVLHNHLPATIRYMNVKAAEPKLKDSVHGSYKRVGKNIGLLDRIPRGSQADMDSEFTKHHFVKLRLSGKAGEYAIKPESFLYRVKEGTLPKGTELYELKSGGKWKQIDGEDIKHSWKPVMESKFIYLRDANDPTAPVLKVPVNKATASRIIIRQGGIAQLGQPNRLEASRKWLDRNLGKEQVKDLSRAEKVLSGIINNWMAYGYNTTIGLLNTKVGLTNLIGGFASNVRTLGMHWTVKGVEVAKDKSRPEFRRIHDLIEELGILKSGKQWIEERIDPRAEEYTPKKIMAAYKRARKTAGDISFSAMSATEWVNRSTAAYGAAVRAVSSLRDGGQGLRWDKTLSVSDNVFHAENCRKRYGVTPKVGRYRKNWSAAQKKAWANEIFDKALRSEIIGAVQQSQLLYGAMSPALFQQKFLKPFAMLQQWVTRYLDRSIREDIPDFFSGKDPGKLVRNMVTLTAIDAVAQEFWLEDEHAINVDSVTQERLGNLPGLNQVAALQKGGTLETIGKAPTGLQRPFFPGPAVGQAMAGWTALTSALNGGGAGFYDEVRKKHGNATDGLLFGRSILNYLDFVNAGDSDDPEAPYLQYSFRGSWAPGDPKVKRKVTEFERWYLLLGPGTPQRLKKQYDVMHAAHLRKQAVPLERYKEEAVDLFLAKKSKELKAFQQEHDFVLTKADVRRILKDRKKPHIMSALPGMQVKDKLWYAELLMREEIASRKEMKELLNSIGRGLQRSPAPRTVREKFKRLIKVYEKSKGRAA